MRKILVSALFVLLPSLAHGQAGGYIRNDALANINGANLTVGSAQVDAAGRQTVTAVGSSALALGKAEDAVAANGDVGALQLAQRQDTITASTSASDDYTALKADVGGRLYVNPYGSSFLLLNKACVSGITTTASTPILGAGGAGVRFMVYDVDCYNTSAVASEFVILDGATALWRGYVAAVTSTGMLYQKGFQSPLVGTANTALNVQMTTTATATTCCASVARVSDF